MKAKILFLTIILILVFSCGETTDQGSSTNDFYIKNATEANIKVVYVAHTIFNNTVTAEIEAGKEAKLFTFYVSGWEYNPLSYPSSYDTAYVYYADKILIDSVHGKGLLERSNFITDPTETYTKKYETYYKEVFTIDSTYINSHFK